MFCLLRSDTLQELLFVCLSLSLYSFAFIDIIILDLNGFEYENGCFIVKMFPVTAENNLII